MSKLKKITRGVLLVTAANFAMSIAAKGADGPLDYRVLATSKTSTMDNELNEAGADGYRFAKAMGGKSANTKKPPTKTELLCSIFPDRQTTIWNCSPV